MSSALDMSLDDLIKKNKKSGGGRGRGRNGGAGTEAAAKGLGPIRKGFKRSSNTVTPYSRPISQAPDSTWQHDKFDAEMMDALAPSRLLKIETGTKVAISNLDYGVSNDDVKELFSEVGDLKRHAIHYDRSGRSKGTGEVVFARRAHAEAAVRRYNNVQLDGKPLKLEIIGTNLTVPAPAIPHSRVRAVRPAVQSVNGGGSRGLAKRGPRGRGGRGSGRKGKRNETKSAADLDAELENYHAEAMQTN